MSVKYTIPFKNIANQQCRVDIDILSYTGDPIALRGTGRGNTFTLIWQPDEETMSHVLIASNAALNVYQQDGNIDVEELQLLGDRDALMLYYEGDVLKWKGFVVSDGLQQPFNGAVESVTIQAVDGLKLLEGVNTTSPNTTATGTPNRAPINYFRDLLWNRLGNELPIRFVLNSLECTAYPDTNVMAGSVQWSPRGQGYSDDAGNVRSAYWTLFGMTDSFFARIYQSDGYWVVERKPDIITGEYEAKEVEDITITDVSVNVNKTIGKTGDYPFIREDAFLMTKAAIKKVETTYNHTQKENIVPNGDFDQLVTADIMYWYFANPITGITIKSSGPSLSERPGTSFHAVFASEGQNRETYIYPSDSGKDGIPIDLHTLFKTFDLSFKFLPVKGFPYFTDTNLIDWSSNPLRIRLSTFVRVAGNINEYVLNSFGFWTAMPINGLFRKTNIQGSGSSSNYTTELWVAGSPVNSDLVIFKNGAGNVVVNYSVPKALVNNLLGVVQDLVDVLDNEPNRNVSYAQDGGTPQDPVYKITINGDSSYSFFSSVDVTNNGAILGDGSIPVTVENMKIEDIAQVDFKAGNPMSLPDSENLDSESDPNVGRLFIRLYVKEGQEVYFDDVTITVNDNSDVYSAEILTSNGNTAVEKRELNISSSFSGFFNSNYMTAWTRSSDEYRFDNGTDEGSLTRLHAIDTLRTRSKAAKVFTGSINVRSGGWKFGEVYTIPTLDGKKFISLGATWKCEDCEVQLTALEAFYDTELMLDVKHYGSETEPINI